MKTRGLRGALLPKLGISIAVMLLVLTLACMGSSTSTHDAIVSMAPVNSKAGENTAWQLVETWAGTVNTPGKVLPTKPVLYLPENKAYSIDNGRPYFEWAKGESADNHNFVVDNDSDFSSPEDNHYFTDDNSHTIPVENTLSRGTYYWKVIAINAVGENESDVYTFKVSMLYDPVIRGYIENTESIRFPYELDVKDNYVYVCALGNDALVILDWSDPSSPSIIGQYKSSTYLDGPTQPIVRDNYVYVCAYDADRLTIIDVSDPTNPTLAGSVQDRTKLDGAQGLYVSGDYAYVCSYLKDRLTSVDISDPTNPTIADDVYDFSKLNQPVQVEVWKNYAYVAATRNNYLTIVDVSDPTNLSIAASLQDADNIDYPEEIIIGKAFENGAWRAKYAYVACFGEPVFGPPAYRISVVDVSDIDNLFVAGHVEDTENLNRPGRMDLMDNYLFVSNNYGDGVTVIDVTNPELPEVIGAITDSNYFSNIGCVKISGKYVYATGPNGREDTFPVRVVCLGTHGLLTRATNLLCENQTNPTNITDNSLEFSAIHHHGNIDENNDTENIEIWIGTFEGDNSVWASGWIDIATTPDGQRCEDVSYTGENELVEGTTYWWQCRFMDNVGTIENWSFAQTFKLNVKPNPPTELLCEGKTNPTDIVDNTPEFSAIFTDNDSGDSTQYIEIWVDNEEGDNDMWASGWITITKIENNERCEDVSYAGSELEDDVTYYWQCRFKDNLGVAGEWSDPATFKKVDKETYWENWTYWKKIIIGNEKVENENFVNFPVLISWDSDPDLAAHIGHDNGDDIAFTDNEYNLLDYEIENFDNSTGKLVAWVRVPTLYGNENTKIVIRYGNASAVNQESPAGVWDDNYVAVWHMKDNTASSILDSTSNNNDGNKKGANEPIENTSGKIWYSQTFDGTDDYIYATDSDSLDLTNEITISAWVYPNSVTGKRAVIAKNDSDDIPQNYELRILNEGLAFYFYTGTNTLHYWATLDSVVSTDVWQYVTLSFTFGTGSSIKMYVNGEPRAGTWTDGDENTAPPANAHDADIGRDRTAYFAGKIDELRLSKKARSAGWIYTRFLNENEPSRFYSVGSEETSGAWQLIETWIGAVEAPLAQWHLIETWTSTVKAPAAWQLIESWTGTIQAPAEWQLIETWTGTVSAPAQWHLTETWTGTIEAPAAWQAIETWTGTVEAQVPAWHLIETWTSTVKAPVAWQLIESWTGIVEAVGVPDFTISVNPTSGSVQQGSGTTATVTVTSINNYGLTVSLEASGQPSGVTASFSPSSGTPNFNSTVTINVGSNAPTGDYTITITGTGADNKVHTCTYALTITASPPPPPPPPPGDSTPPPTPSLVSPTNGASMTDNTPLLDWSDVSDPSGVTYSLSIAANNEFTSIVLQKTGLAASSYEITLDEVLADGAYYWRVRAVDGVGNIGSWSEGWSFTVSIASPLLERGVQVTISENSKSGKPSEELNFPVTVTNTGTETDTFSLTASDTKGWSPTLSVTSTTLAAGASEPNIELSITIPSTATEGDSTTMTVTATGTGYENSASCTAHVVIIIGVEVSISPESQSGLPGEMLTFTVTVKNTGETEDTYDLSVSDDANWETWLNENMLTISADENGATTVSVIVPSDAIENEYTVITVTATSRADDTVSASDTCGAVATAEAPSPPRLPWVIGIVLIVIATVAASALYVWKR